MWQSRFPDSLGKSAALAFSSVHFSSVTQSCPTLWPPWTAGLTSLSITSSRSLLKPSIESVMLSYHLIFCCPLLLLRSIFPRIRVFLNESALWIRWPKYWSFSFTSVLPMNIQDWSPLGWTGWISLQSKGLSRVFSKPQFKSINSALSFPYSPNSHIHTWLLEKQSYI